ncbi:ABC-2 type transport system permease protein [Saccharopolyspora erythraea NRRL 2338]|uniref:ABC transporter membrane protein n=2 Tax=Saccharopolyspora erythraea TaxID=1836 RepID=A4FQU2_SACEN|nr:ABC transporter permease [Saccharopolyspora erythraea]EQD85723.1 membrane protein [Saccharopolyspora erythraea D]PFG93019.1 ABC-2 type transport system permease protein [Saccharopolyspora erythraea NRRL 2338]QRK89905.1 ABC transporter permease [Saccharopolyspora erythraea]CAM06417.1 putative ABC transporter membrane protein [Saccharopolyspora erythraea NRRL 2338]
MTLLAVERIKLFSTRSPWWCTVVALGLTIGFGWLFVANIDNPTLSMSQQGSQFGQMVVMVMAVLAVTTEYRFGTIRSTFQAVPNRTAALLAKTTVVALMALVVGELAAFGSWLVAKVVAPAGMELATAEDWRLVAGVGLVFALGAVFAVAVGVLVRQSAGAVTILLIWSMLVENLVAAIPNIGVDIQRWLPFTNANHFLSEASPFGSSMPFGPWGSLAYFAAIVFAVLAAALAVANRRDA